MMLTSVPFHPLLYTDQLENRTMTPPRQKTWIKYIDFIKYICRELTNRIWVQTNKVDCWQLIVRIDFPLVPLVLQDMKCRQKNSSVSRVHHIMRNFSSAKGLGLLLYEMLHIFFVPVIPTRHMRKRMGKKKHNCRSKQPPLRALPYSSKDSTNCKMLNNPTLL